MELCSFEFRLLATFYEGGRFKIEQVVNEINMFIEYPVHTNKKKTFATK